MRSTVSSCQRRPARAHCVPDARVARRGDLAQPAARRSRSTRTTSAAWCRGPKGPEAGVWVIAETRDLGVRYIKSVVTDDRGRYVVPDLPAAKYQVWARGYGLVDSAKTAATPGQQLNITAVPAPSEAEAAKYYPAIYWYSMLKIPGADEFGGKAHDIAPRLTEQRQWIAAMKNTGCIGCHQLGQESTRTIPPSLGTFATGADAWKRRVQSGQSGAMMHGQLTNLGERAFTNYGEWTDRVAKGELPFAKPARPQGVERNIVVTLRDWMDDKHYLHDLIASDRRHPTVNAYGPVFGSPEYSSDLLPILDPIKNVATTFKAPVRDPQMPLNLGPGPRRRPRSDDAVALLGQRADLGDPGQQPQLDVRQGRPVVAGRVGAAAPTTRRGARPARRTRRPRRSRWTAPSVIWPYSTRRR